MENKNIITLKKINERAGEAMLDTKDLTYEEFIKDDKTVRATVFSISQIGELVKDLDDEFTNKYNNIMWSKIKGLRNRIVHDYDGIQLNIVWQIIKNNLPELTKDIDNIIKNERS